MTLVVIGLLVAIAALVVVLVVFVVVVVNVMVAILLSNTTSQLPQFPHLSFSSMILPSESTSVAHHNR